MQSCACGHVFAATCLRYNGLFIRQAARVRSLGQRLSASRIVFLSVDHRQPAPAGARARGGLRKGQMRTRPREIDYHDKTVPPGPSPLPRGKPSSLSSHHDRQIIVHIYARARKHVRECVRAHACARELLVPYETCRWHICIHACMHACMHVIIYAYIHITRMRES